MDGLSIRVKKGWKSLIGSSTEASIASSFVEDLRGSSKCGEGRRLRAGPRARLSDDLEGNDDWDADSCGWDIAGGYMMMVFAMLVSKSIWSAQDR